jgi:hypothetical protein
VGRLKVNAFVSVFAKLCKVMVGKLGLRLKCSCCREGFYSAEKGFLAGAEGLNAGVRLCRGRSRGRASSAEDFTKLEGQGVD